MWCFFDFSCRWTSLQSGTGRVSACSAVGGGNNNSSNASSSRSSGSGQVTPALSARTRYSQIVVLADLVLAAICRDVRPAALSRMTSLIFRMGSLFLGTPSSFN
jgi:hypothetical protein